jgi:signal recognition particle subunit SRP54
MDGAIGQAAEAQARAFRDTVPIGAIILTKMDGHARGGGALSAVAATGAPIAFLGTGEHLQDLERFSGRPFISKMLGMGDIGGLIDQMQELKLDENSDMQKRLEQGLFTLRDMYEQFQMIMSLGPINKVMANLPGFTSDMFKGSEKEISQRFKTHMTIMDSMTNGELDHPDSKLFHSQPTRITRIAKGSGTSERLVNDLLAQYRQFASIMKKMGGPKGLLSQFSGGASASSPSSSSMEKMSPAQLAKMNQQMSQMLPPDLLKQMGIFLLNFSFASYIFIGGMGALSNMMNQFQDAFANGPSSPGGGNQRKS